MLTAGNDAETRVLKVLGSFETALGGVIYGWVANDEPLLGSQFQVEIFANGIHIGTTSAIDAAVEFLPNEQVRRFKLLVPMNLILDAPVIIRGRVKDTTYEIGNQLMLVTTEEMNSALHRAQGVVRMEAGILRGFLNKVNPDTLPLTVCVFVNDQLLSQTDVDKPDILVQSGHLLDDLPFRIPLPTSILTGTSVNVSVKLEGSEIEFDGSPLNIAVTAGASFSQRLAEIEATVEGLSERLRNVSSQVVADVSEHFYRYIIPRVDGIVQTQRQMLEAQMIELWQQVTGREKPMPRPGLPSAVTQRMDESFTGFGWSHIVAQEGRAERWFNKTGFIAVNISSCNPLLLRLTGSSMIGTPRASGLSLSANGVTLDVVVTEPQPDGGWAAIALVPRAALRSDGVLGIQCSMTTHGFHPDSPDNPVSARVGTLDLAPLEHQHDRETIDVQSDAILFAHGWYDPEQTDAGDAFRWMASQAILVVPPALGQLSLLELRGPFLFPDESAVEQALRISLNRHDLPRHEFQSAGHGPWSARFEVPQGLSLDDGGLLVLQAPIGTPQNDLRALSVAVSQIRFRTATDIGNGHSLSDASPPVHVVARRRRGAGRSRNSGKSAGDGSEVTAVRRDTTSAGPPPLVPADLDET